MKAKLYTLKVSESSFASVHGQIFEIQEIFIPELNIAFNIVDNKINVFEVDEKARRYYRENSRFIKDIDVPSRLIGSMRTYLEAKAKLERIKPQFSMLLIS